MLDNVIASAPKKDDQCTAVYNNKNYSQCSANSWFGFHWTGPIEPSQYDLTTQASALEALVAAINPPNP